MRLAVVDSHDGKTSSKSGGRFSSTQRLKFDQRRIYSALVFIPLFYLLTRYCSPLVFFLFVLTIVLACLWEFYALHFNQSSRQPCVYIGLLCGMLLLVSLQWPSAMNLSTAFLIILLLLMLYQVSMTPRPSSYDSIPVLLFGVIYIGLTLGHLALLRQVPDGPFLVFFVILVTWAGDTAAYYTGRNWGTRPLAPILSPRKTQEGLIGGLIASLLAAWVAHLWFFPGLSGFDCLFLGLLFTALGLLGDLSESAFKRQAGVKDSGMLIPGHGGLLDRIDSLLLTVPTFYYYMVLVKGV